MLFPKIIRLNEVSQLEWYVDRDMLQKHAVTVMEGLGAAVESLQDSHFLNGVLMALGQTHVRRNIKPAVLKVRGVSAGLALPERGADRPGPDPRQAKHQARRVQGT